MTKITSKCKTRKMDVKRKARKGKAHRRNAELYKITPIEPEQMRKNVDALIGQFIRVRGDADELQDELQDLVERFHEAVGVPEWWHPNINVSRRICGPRSAMEEAVDALHDVASFLATDDALDLEEIKARDPRDSYVIEKAKELKTLLAEKNLMAVRKADPVAYILQAVGAKMKKRIGGRMILDDLDDVKAEVATWGKGAKYRYWPLHYAPVVDGTVTAEDAAKARKRKAGKATA